MRIALMARLSDRSDLHARVTVLVGSLEESGGVVSLDDSEIPAAAGEIGCEVDGSSIPGYWLLRAPASPSPAPG